MTPRLGIAAALALACAVWPVAARAQQNHEPSAPGTPAAKVAVHTEEAHAVDAKAKPRPHYDAVLASDVKGKPGPHYDTTHAAVTKPAKAAAAVAPRPAPNSLKLALDRIGQQINEPQTKPHYSRRSSMVTSAPAPVARVRLLWRSHLTWPAELDLDPDDRIEPSAEERISLSWP